MADRQCQQLDCYLDGEFGDSGRRDFERHLADCASCREEVAIQQRLDGALLEFAESLKTPDFESTTLAPCKPSKKSRPQALQRRTWIACGCAAAIFLAATVVAFNVLPGNRPALVNKPPELALDPPDATSLAKQSLPHIRTVQSEQYMAVVEPPADDGLTVVMLYPQLLSSN